MKGLIKLGFMGAAAVCVIAVGGWGFSTLMDKGVEAAAQAKAQVQTEVFKSVAKEGLKAAKAEVTQLLSDWKTANPTKENLIVGWADYDAPPNIMFNEEGDAFGFDVDLFNAIIADMDIQKIEHVHVPFAELLPGVESGKFDIVISAISETPGREERVDFTHSYMTAGLMIAVPYKMEGASLLHSAPGILKSLGAFIVVILIFALLMALIEGRKEGSEIKNFDDACQLVFYYMSTIGSGDLNPRTRLGRMVLLLAFFSGAVVIGNVIAEITSDRTIARLATSIESPDDLKGKTVATVKATTSVTALDNLGAIPVLRDNITLCWEMLEDEAVQAVVFDAPTIKYHAMNDGKEKIAITGDVFNEEHFGMAVAEGSPLREALNLSLLRIRDNGQYQEIWDKWFSEEDTETVREGYKMSQEVIMLCGMPGSGKSSVTEPYEKKGYVRLNRDLVGGPVKNLLPKMAEALADGKSCILDNTHVTVKARADFIKAAQDAGVPIHAKWVSTLAEDCQFNACTRMMHREGRILSPAELKDHKSPNMFPPGVIFMFRKQFEQPRQSEGFATVEEVKYVRRPYPKAYKNKAIILDYDGTLRRSTGDFNWPTTPDEVELLPGRTEVLKKWQSDGYMLLGASNQSPVAKGQFTEAECQEMFDRTNALLGLDIEVMFCPHRVPPIGCYCRKPGPGLAVYFIEKYKLCPALCVVVGDATTDRTFATRCGFKFAWAHDFF